MAQNVRWKHPDGAGGFTELNLPSSAEIVEYNGSTVKNELDNLSATTGVSAFMRRLLRANDAVEARSLLKVGREDIFDETGNRWNSLSACPDTSIKKFGAKSLHTPGSGYLIKPTGLTLGGKNFAIAFWAYAPSASTAAQALCSLGTNKNSIKIFRDSSNKLTTSCAENGSFVFSPASDERVTFPTAQWNHVELDFNYSSGRIYLFLNGSLVCSTTACTLFSTAQAFPFYIGYDIYSASYYFNGYIDEILVTEKLLHTANFTPPSAPYDLDSDTLALLHFD